MRHVVIGVPARNEGETIAELVDALATGAVLLGEVATTEIVLAYQDSGDQTLELFLSHGGSIPKHVLRCPPATAGKGRNVKLLIDHARDLSADLLVVDGDMRDYSPYDVPRFVAAAIDHSYDQVLPLWCRPWGHANVTNHLAVPSLTSVYGARVRQPLAGHRYVSRRALRRLDVDRLPDDYGIDIALTMAVLDDGGDIGQVVMSHIEHDHRQRNSEMIMVEVARALLGRLAVGPASDRRDVVPPGDYVHELRWPDEDEGQGAGTADAEAAREEWLDALAEAILAARRGDDIDQLAARLVHPFVAHGNARRRLPRPSVREAEQFVWRLGVDLCIRLQ